MAEHEEQLSGFESTKVNEVPPDPTSSPRERLKRGTRTSESSVPTMSDPDTLPTPPSSSSTRASPLDQQPINTDVVSRVSPSSTPLEAESHFASSNVASHGGAPESSSPNCDPNRDEFGADYYVAYDPVVGSPEEWYEARRDILIRANPEQNCHDESEYAKQGISFHANGKLVPELYDCDAARKNCCLSKHENEFAPGKGKGRILKVCWRKEQCDGSGKDRGEWTYGRFCVPCINRRICIPDNCEVQFRRGLHAYLLPPAGENDMHPDGKPLTRKRRPEEEVDEDAHRKRRKR